MRPTVAPLSSSQTSNGACGTDCDEVPPIRAETHSGHVALSGFEWECGERVSRIQINHTEQRTRGYKDSEVAATV